MYAIPHQGNDSQCSEFKNNGTDKQSITEKRADRLEPQLSRRKYTNSRTTDVILHNAQNTNHTKHLANQLNMPMKPV
jgi:hypothetical protein